ncbi:hypothetical protein A7982_12956 [Minicystis rosea]|nr:hypothetical protein A7982_12956 [Minicystis rosea]
MIHDAAGSPPMCGEPTPRVHVAHTPHLAETHAGGRGRPSTRRPPEALTASSHITSRRALLTIVQ